MYCSMGRQPRVLYAELSHQQSLQDLTVHMKITTAHECCTYDALQPGCFSFCRREHTHTCSARPLPKFPATCCAQASASVVASHLSATRMSCQHVKWSGCTTSCIKHLQSMLCLVHQLHCHMTKDSTPAAPQLWLFCICYWFVKFNMVCAYLGLDLGA